MTDLPPDGLGSGAFRLKNVRPGSSRGFVPREGTSLVGHYQGNSLGRVIYADALPADLGQGIMLVCGNNTHAAGTLNMTQTIEGLYAFRPDRIADDYAAVAGYLTQAGLYGSYPDGTEYSYALKLIDRAADTAVYTSGTITHQLFPLGSTIIAPFNFTNVDGSVTKYTKGNAFQAWIYLNAATAETILGVNGIDLSSSPVALSGLGFTFSSSFYTVPTAGHAASVLFGLAPMQSGRSGFLVWWNGLAYGVRQGTFIVGGVQRYWITPTDFTAQVATIGDSNIICDISPLPQTSELIFLIGKGGTTSGQEQFIIVRQSLDQKLVVTGTSNTVMKLLGVEYLADSYPGTTYSGAVAGTTVTWSARPDTILVARSLPGMAWNAVLLMGDYVAAPTIHKAITNPRLAVVALLSNGQIALTNTPGSYRAHGMCVDQYGYIYVVGTGGLTGSNTNLIEKYAHWDLSTPVASVAYNSNNLGDGYGTAAATHIMNPVWTGNCLIVEDHDASKTRLFWYDKDLTYITKRTVSTGTVAAGSRIRGGAFASVFQADHY